MLPFPTAAGSVVRTRTQTLEKVFRSLLDERGLDPTHAFYEEEHSGSDMSRDARCRTLVYAANLAAMQIPARFASYGPQPETGGFNMLEVMTAAVALPGQTLPTALPMNRDASAKPEIECMSASIAGYANPSFQILADAQDPGNGLWTPGEIHTLVSIGCGERPLRVSEGWARSTSPSKLRLDSSAVLNRVATGTESTHLQVERLLRASYVDYYRFNAPVSVVSTDIGNWRWTKDTRSGFTERLNRHLSVKSVRDKLEECHERLGINQQWSSSLVSEPRPQPASEDYCEFDRLLDGKQLTRNGP